MCFSATASFGASAVLSAIGVLSYKKAGQSSYRFLATIPFFFGVQQFAEGVVWIAATNEHFSTLLSGSTYSFIFFAWIIWPLYLPFLLWKLEKNERRKKTLLALIIIGAMVSSILTYIMLFHGVKASIEDCSISYNFEFTHPLSGLFGIFYLMTTVITNLISSLPKMWWLGVINFITYFVSKIYYEDHIISVWCFFAAISSVLILYIILQAVKSDTAKT